MRAKNESKLIGEAYSQVHEGIADHVHRSASRGAVPAEFDPSRHGLKKRYKLNSVGGEAGQIEILVGEFDTIDEVIDAINLPEEYGREWTVDIRDNRKWSAEGFEDGFLHHGVQELFDVVDTQSVVEDQEDNPDETALGKAFLASQTAEGAPHTGSYDLGPDRTPEVQVGSHVMWDRQRRFGIVDELDDPENPTVAVVLDDDGAESIVDIEDLEEISGPIEDQELPVGHPLHPDEEAKERESRKKFIKSGSNRGPRIRNTKGELGRSKWPERPHG